MLRVIFAARCYACKFFAPWRSNEQSDLETVGLIPSAVDIFRSSGRHVFDSAENNRPLVKRSTNTKYHTVFSKKII